MVNHSQLETDVQRQYIDHINQRSWQLYHLEKEWSDKAVNFLFLTNSGGAIAMLSFIGTKQQVNDLVVWGLGIMLMGLILVDILIACVYHQMTSLFNAWRRDVNEYFLDKISWEKLQEDDNRRSNDPIFNLCLGYSSLSCFIFGIALGIWGLIKP